MNDTDEYKCPRCTMTFQLERPKGARGPTTICAEKNCETRFGYGALKNKPVRVWLVDGAEGQDGPR